MKRIILFPLIVSVLFLPTLFAGISSRKVTFFSGKEFVHSGESEGSESFECTCGVFKGNGRIKSPRVTIIARDFEFTGTIEYGTECLIITQTPVKKNICTFKGKPHAKFIVDKQRVEQALGAGVQVPNISMPTFDGWKRSVKPLKKATKEELSQQLCHDIDKGLMTLSTHDIRSLISDVKALAVYNKLDKYEVLKCAHAHVTRMAHEPLQCLDKKVFSVSVAGLAGSLIAIYQLKDKYSERFTTVQREDLLSGLLILPLAAAVISGNFLWHSIKGTRWVEKRAAQLRMIKNSLEKEL